MFINSYRNVLIITRNHLDHPTTIIVFVYLYGSAIVHGFNFEGYRHIQLCFIERTLDQTDDDIELLKQSFITYLTKCFCFLSQCQYIIWISF